MAGGAIQSGLIWTYKYPNEIGPGVFDIHSPRVPKVRAPFHEARSTAILSRCCASGKRPLAAPKLSIM
jgi:methionine synthase II (cobalamin-independent)